MPWNRLEFLFWAAIEESCGQTEKTQSWLIEWTILVSDQLLWIWGLVNLNIITLNNALNSSFQVGSDWLGGKLSRWPELEDKIDFLICNIINLLDSGPGIGSRPARGLGLSLRLSARQPSSYYSTTWTTSILESDDHDSESPPRIASGYNHESKRETDSEVA